MPTTQPVVPAMQTNQAMQWIVNLRNFSNRVFLMCLSFSSANSSWRGWRVKPETRERDDKRQEQTMREDKERKVCNRSSHSCLLVTRQKENKHKGGVCVCVCAPRSVHKHLELCADVFRHEVGWAFLDDPEVPRAESFYSQNAVRLVDSEAPTEWLRHAVERFKP